MRKVVSLRVRCAVVWLLLSAACGGGAPLSRMPDPRDAVALPARTLPAVQAEAAWQRARGVFEQRCVVCHGCYDAPCQLKLESYAGVTRAASPAVV